MIGKIISHYKILEKIGQGGMGIVYKAEDSKLKRIVALKFLPHHLTINETDKTRFMQEAQAACAINHPNVCVIHDIQEYEDQQFIVMEYIEGKTLGEHIESSKSARLNLDEIIDYAIQIAEALEAAHEKSIIHRDIKSENIMVNSKNQIKVMDFGLAKLKGSAKLTKSSSTVGTIAYMSPEQIQGHDIDARSDIFSFGVVLYEMLTGTLPFKGDYEAAVTFAILNQPPDPVQKYRPDLSSELLHILNRALEKEPENRYQTIRDVLIDLKRLKRDSQKPADSDLATKIEHVTNGTPHKSKRKWLVFLPVPFLILATILFLIRYSLDSRQSVSPGDMKIIKFTNLPGKESAPAFSPDGKQIAFHHLETDTSDADIYIQLVGTIEAVQLTNNPANDLFPVWTPDGLQIAFARHSADKDIQGVYLMSVLGKSERKISSRFAVQLCFSPNGEYLAFTERQSKSVHMISMKAYTTYKLTSLPLGIDNGDWYPAFSPNSKMLAFVRSSSYASGNIYTMSIPDGEPKQLASENCWMPGITWTPDGKSIIFSSNRSGPYRLWQVNVKSGKTDPLAASGQNSVDPDISKDGRWLAYSEVAPWEPSWWRIRLPETPGQKITPMKFTTREQSVFDGRFSPDGKKIAVISNRTGISQLWSCDIDLENWIQLTDLKRGVSFPCWSPSSDSIVFESRIKGPGDIFIISAGGGVVRAATHDSADDILPFWSKDGKWIYFTSNRSGESQIWKIPSKGGEAVRITDNGAEYAQPSPDGKWLYYTRNWLSIWRRPMDGGEESMILKGLDENHWTPTDDGIYFFHRILNGYSLKFLKIDSGEIINVGMCDYKEIIRWPKLSADGQWIEYRETKMPFEADIYLVEDFR
ncbi:serine/threonine-protein kinase [candidate division KSB1 bacterium]|nr:serine/threonine-protein kinase [candidate division KSB1 bacterium]